MQYKTELHAHCSEVSPCATMSAAQVVDRYLDAGYTSLVVANHYCDYVIDTAGDTWEEKIAHYLSGYRIMKEYAKDRLHVLLGCELRFVENQNDYLVFGMTEEFLTDHPNLHHMTLKTFSAFAKKNNLLLVQAHPFRNGMTVMNPKYLDGIEVYNGHTEHDSRNFLADAFARRYGLLRTSGSDFHHETSAVAGGILTDSPVVSMEELVDILRTGDCTLICAGPVAEREGMTDMPAKY